MNRIEKLREFVDEILLNKKDDDDRRCGYVHLYGVAFSCALIAQKRGANVELAVMAGMLHDLYSFKMKDIVSFEEAINNHGEKGAVYAREILNELKITSTDETNAICSAIHNHSDKSGKYSDFDEILVDADVMQHCYYNPLFPVNDHERERFEKLQIEFGLNSTV